MTARRVIRESYHGATGVSRACPERSRRVHGCASSRHRCRAGTPGSPLANYFCVGAGFCGAAGGAEGVVGVAGCDLVWVDFTPESTDVGPVRRAAKIERVIDVSMKIIADQVVARERTEAAPRGPNAVWLPCPPKAAARSPLFPLCSKTTAIRNRQTIT